MLAGAFTATAVAGVHLGGRLADHMDPERTLRAFATGLVALALYTLARAAAALV